jgi:putative flippase GtrA
MSTQSDLQKGAIVGGVINAVINGLIYWFQVKGQAEVALTEDSISSTAHTVFASAVPLATSLAFILSSIAYFSVKVPGKPSYFPKVFLFALKNALFAFGTITVIGILVQRFMGTVHVSPVTATLITALIAGLIAGVVDYLTKQEVMNAASKK